MKNRLEWSSDGADWPNRQSSSFNDSGGIKWHVQCTGDGPAIVVVHGVGASTHSWAGLTPLLAERARVVAVDLPGHGFTSARASGIASVPWMARAVAGLIRDLHVDPVAIVGHSAGAAIAVRMALDGLVSPRTIVALNGALLPFPGAASQLFPMLAKMLFLNPFVPRLMAWQAGDDRAVRRVIEGTGSHLDARGLALYARLFRDPGHVDAALAMMANWNLEALAADLPKLAVPLTLIAAEGDRAIAPAQADRVATMVPGARVIRVAGLGHLAHEEAPARIAPLILKALTDAI